MGFTAAEKLLGRRAGRDVKAGEVVTVPVDAILTNDASGPLSIDYFGKMGVEQIAHPERSVAIIDHYVPCPNSRVASLQQMLYSFRDRYGIRLVEAGDGTLDIYRYQKPGKRGMMPKDRVTWYNRIDMGIFLLFTEHCLSHEHLSFTRTLYRDDGEDQEMTLTARYRIL